MNSEEQFEKIVRDNVELASSRIRAIVASSKELKIETLRNIVGTYRIAIEPNFIPWMQLSHDTAKSELARKVIVENIYDEVTQDHPEMLRAFSASSGVLLTPNHYLVASKPVAKMWELYSKRDGVTNVAIAATLERTSMEFIPYLAEIGLRCGCSNFTYTNVHGEEDIKHADELHLGLIDEMRYASTPWRNVATAMDETAGFLEQILTPWD